MGPSSDHSVRLLGVEHWAFSFFDILLPPVIIRHDEYQACGKEADEIVLRVF